VRSSGRRFIVVPGHVDAVAEKVVTEHDEYVVTEKLGEAGDLAEKLDPRDPD
jgi:hypothetical protein